MLNALFRLTRARFKHRCVWVLDGVVKWRRFVWQPTIEQFRVIRKNYWRTR